jgi:hypothetical protein
MNLEDLAARMAENAEAIRALAEGLPEAQVRWKPDPGAWSILEVVNHLYDEEIEDFRAHLDLVLNHPGGPWPRIDPEGWVTERGYSQRDLGRSLNDFLRAREDSLTWLKGLKNPDWEVAYQAPFGSITAGDLMASWVAHDLLHMRQLIRLHWAYLTQNVQPHQVRYAGPW